MSFGFSLGDFINIGTLAWNIYKSAKAAPEAFRNIHIEVLSFHAVIKEAEETLFQSPMSNARSARLESIGEGCRSVLSDLNSVVKRYESLNTKSKRTWDRMKWGKEDIVELRLRMISSMSMLNAFISTSQTCVQMKLDKYRDEFRHGQHEGSIVSSHSVDSLSRNDRVVWRSIRKDLEDIGITVAAFDANRDFIFRWFIHAVHTNAFEEHSSTADHGDLDESTDDSNSDSDTATIICPTSPSGEPSGGLISEVQHDTLVKTQLSPASSDEATDSVEVLQPHRASNDLVLPPKKETQELKIPTGLTSHPPMLQAYSSNFVQDQDSNRDDESLVKQADFPWLENAPPIPAEPRSMFSLSPWNLRPCRDEIQRLQKEPPEVSLTGTAVPTAFSNYEALKSIRNKTEQTLLRPLKQQDLAQIRTSRLIRMVSLESLRPNQRLLKAANSDEPMYEISAVLTHPRARASTTTSSLNNALLKICERKNQVKQLCNVIRLLLENGADPSAAYEDTTTYPVRDQSALLLLCDHPIIHEEAILDAVRLFTERRVILNGRPGHIMMQRYWKYVLADPLFACIQSYIEGGMRTGTLRIAEQLLSAGASANNQENPMRNLQLAVIGRSKAMVDLLIRYGANIDPTGETIFHEYRSPLVIAAQNEDLDIMELLLDNGASIDRAVMGCGTALSAATQRGNVNSAKLLLQRGAAIRIDSESSEDIIFVTDSMQIAAHHCELEIFRLLVGAGGLQTADQIKKLHEIMIDILGDMNRGGRGIGRLPQAKAIASILKKNTDAI